MVVTFVLPIYVQFISYLCFILRNPLIFTPMYFFVFHCDDNISGPFPVDCLWTVPNDILRVMRR